MSGQEQPWTGLDVPELTSDEEFAQRLVRGVDRFPDSLSAPPVFNPDHGGYWHYPWQDAPDCSRSMTDEHNHLAADGS